jgi:hypothetical protein
MKKLFALAALLLLLTACVPALTPILERQDADVLVSVVTTRAVYDVQLVILSASTSDARCTAFSSDLVCELGDFSARKETSLVVQGPVGEVSCVAYGFLREDLSMSSYRPFACAVR